MRSGKIIANLLKQPAVKSLSKIPNVKIPARQFSQTLTPKTIAELKSNQRREFLYELSKIKQHTAHNSPEAKLLETLLMRKIDIDIGSTPSENCSFINKILSENRQLTGKYIKQLLHYSLDDLTKIAKLGSSFDSYKELIEQSQQRGKLLEGLVKFRTTNWGVLLKKNSCINDVIDFLKEKNLFERVVTSENMTIIFQLSAILLDQKMHEFIPAVISDKNVDKLLEEISSDNQVNEAAVEELNLKQVVYERVKPNTVYHQILIENSDIAGEIAEFARRVNSNTSMLDERQINQIVKSINALKKYQIWDKVESALNLEPNFDWFPLILEKPDVFKIAFDLIGLIKADSFTQLLILEKFTAHPHLAQNFYNDCSYVMQNSEKPITQEEFLMIVDNAIKTCESTNPEPPKAVNNVSLQGNWASCFKSAESHAKGASEKANNAVNACRERLGLSNGG